MPPAGKRGGPVSPSAPGAFHFLLRHLAGRLHGAGALAPQHAQHFRGRHAEMRDELALKVRRDMPQASAMSSIDQRADSRASIFCTSSRNGAPARSCSRRVWLYWRWSPPRRMKTTSRRATCCDSSGPWSRSIRPGPGRCRPRRRPRSSTCRCPRRGETNLHPQRGVQLAQPVGRAPVRGDDAAVEQAGASQQEGAGADAASAARAGVAPAQPGARLAMGAGALHAGAAGHHDHVHRTIPVFREGAVHLHAQALVPGGDHGFGGHGAQLVQRGLGFLVGGAERLPGAG